MTIGIDEIAAIATVVAMIVGAIVWLNSTISKLMVEVAVVNANLATITKNLDNIASKLGEMDVRVRHLEAQSKTLIGD